MKAEVKLINAICKNKDIASVLQTDTKELFVDYKDVWDGILEYYHRYDAVPDMDWVSDNYRDVEPVEVSGETAFYIDATRSEHLKTQMKSVLIDTAQALDKRSPAELLEHLQKQVARMTKATNLVRDVDVTDVEGAVEELNQRRLRAEEFGGAPGIASGIPPFDAAYPTGLAGGHFIVVLGWSGRGKSWFQSLLACKAWEAGYKPMIVSLEMSPEQMRDRIYTILGSGMFSNRQFSRGDVDITTFEKWGRNNLNNRQGFVIVSSEGSERVTANTVQGKIDQYRPDIVFLDYHQLFDDAGSGGNETVKNRNISRDFKLLAVRNDIPVVDISQATQSDTADLDAPPDISQVAWSRGIQHDADLALSVHRSPDGGLMEVSAKKNRHGPLFSFYIDWDIDKGTMEYVYA